MLSVCIPVYNCDVTNLVRDLWAQLEKNKIPSEIILIDDASNIEFRQINKKLAKTDRIRYVQLEKNIGRSRIRNLFLSYNGYDYLLFLDCDSQITNYNYIKHHLKQIEHNHLVICGGRSYLDKRPDKKHYLRWKYGLERESILAEKRAEKPYQSFMTNNFVVHAKVLSQIQFDERLNQYGHEDTLFGFRLKQNEISVTHIDNPTQHIYSESNIEFIQKSEYALKSLAEIKKFINDKGFDNELKILRIYKKTSRFGMKYVLVWIGFLFAPLILSLVKKNIGGLYLFDFYKLLYFSRLAK